jgi:hypothetical protein
LVLCAHVGSVVSATATIIVNTRMVFWIKFCMDIGV